MRAPLATATPIVLTAAELLDFAEKTYPLLFPPTGKRDGIEAPYTYRYYPQSGNYLGVSTGSTDVAVYLFGPISNWQIARVGALSAFLCEIKPLACEVRTLSISQFGSGSVVGGDGQAICAGQNCSRDYSGGTAIEVTASAASGWRFHHWSGCDSAVGSSCSVVLTTSKTVHPFFESIAPPVLKADTVLLTPETMQLLNPSRGSVLIFSNAATQIATLKAGSVIYSTVGEGLLRRVASVIALAGGSYVVDTTDATLEDLVAEGTLILDSRAASQAASTRSGALATAGSAPLQVELLSPQLEGFSAVGTLSLQELDGAFSFDLGGIKEFKFVASPKLTLSQIQMKLQDRLIDIKRDIPIGITFAPILVGPVVLVPTVNLRVTFLAKAEVGVELNGQLTASAGANMHWVRGNGWNVLGNYDVNGSFALLDPLAIATGEADAAFGLVAGLKLYGVAGPELVNSVFINAKGTDTISQEEACIRWKVKGGLRSRAEGEVKILSWKLSAKYTLGEIAKTFYDESALKCEDKEKPSKVTSGTVAPVSPTQLRVSWQAATDNVAVVGYAVTRNNLPIGTQASETFIDSNLQPDTEYCYTVTAFDKAGNRGLTSSSFCGRTPARDTTPPGAPAALTALPTSTTSIRLGWAGASDSGGVAAYVIYQDGKEVGQTSGTEPTSYITKLTPNTRYCYTVAAIDVNGNIGPKSPEACATTLSAAAWTMKIRCNRTDVYVVEKDVDLDIGSSQTLDVVGNAIDYNGTPMAYHLFGDYRATDGSLAAQIRWTFAGSNNVRLDEFNTTLNTADTGDVRMQQIRVTGCDAYIRFVRKTGSASTPLGIIRPQAAPGPGISR